jgi:Glyoxalase-like domain
MAALDHMPLVVVDLELASAAYTKLGFVLKPGRPHENGIRNRHVKFPDGSGIELLAPELGPKDALAAHYVSELADGEGPVHFALHARDDEQLTNALRREGFAFHRENGVLSLDDAALSFLFFGGDNRSPTDRPEHYAHTNSATAMSGVWIALDPDAAKRMSRLLIALGAKHRRDVLPLGNGVRVDVFVLSNGRIALLPTNRRVRPQRPIVGVEFRVLDLGKVVACRRANVAASKHSCLVPPSATYGLWMRFSD